MSTQHKFVFIGGLHRSGTTLLHDCIAAHPDVSGLSDTDVPMNEGQFLQTVFPPFGTKRKLWPIRYLKPVLPASIATRGYGGPGRFAFDPGAFLDETSPLATPESRASILDSWSPYWDMTRSVLVEKSPPNLVRTRLLQALFEKSYFIILYRHPIPVSYATRRWATRRPMYLLFKHWIVANRRFTQDAPRLKRVISLRYEDFVSEPDAVLRRLFDFLELSPVGVPEPVSSAINGKYFERWNEEVLSSSAGRAYARFLHGRFEQAFNEFGYTMEGDLLDGPRAGLL